MLGLWSLEEHCNRADLIRLFKMVRGFLLFSGHSFYCAMHFGAKRGIAIACCLSVHLSVTLVDCDHIGWNTWKLISPLVSLGCSLFATPT